MPGELSRYPDNWKEIALAIKEREGWHCYRCGVRCLRPGEKLFSAKSRAFLIQVHHWDCDPGNNNPENLVALCTVCHLHMHRQRHGSIAVGQGMLGLDVARCLPSRSAPRMPLAVQLMLWERLERYRQLELWD
jgi:hypothetical protein